MTLNETRQLGIEFERRVQNMSPEREFVDKLDSETIFSYLNQYQDKYIHEIYRNLDAIPSGTKVSAHVETVLQSLLKGVTVKIADAVDNNTTTIEDKNNIGIIDTARSATFELPTDFYMYLRSVSNVSSTYSFIGGTSDSEKKIRVLPNELMSQSDVWKLVETPHNTLRIMRYPAAVLNTFSSNSKPTITIICDLYTTLEGIRVMYYKQPAHFDIMTSTPCELPMDTFEDIVSGAIELYTEHASIAAKDAAMKQRAAQALKLAEDAQKKQAKENNE